MPRDPSTHVGVAVKIDGTEIVCDPDSGEPQVLSGLKVTWGRRDRITMPDSTTCDFELDVPDGADYASLVEVDSVVEVLTVPPDGSARLRVFMGQVSDLSLTHDEEGSATVTVTAVDPVARFSTVMIGDSPWPEELPKNRRGSILAAIPSGSFNFPALPDYASGGTYDYAAYRQAALDIDNQPAWDIIRTLIWSLAMTPWPIAYGSKPTPGMVYTGGIIVNTVGGGTWTQQVPAVDTRASRRDPVADFRPTGSGTSGVPARTTVVVDACDVVLDGSTFTANPADSVQARKVSWGGSGETGSIYYKAPAPYEDPARAFDIQTNVANTGYAQNVARAWDDQMTRWAEDFAAPWGVGAVKIDPDLVTSIDDFHLVLARLLEQTTRPNHALMLQNLPAWTPWRAADDSVHEPNVLGFVQGGVYTYDEGRWVLELNMSVERALQSSLAPGPVVEVHPGDTVPYRHDDDAVTFEPVPTTAWPVGDTATFADGEYGWDGDEWVRGGVQPIYARPGTELTVPHDDPRVVPEPTTTWGPDEHVTFTDGDYTWNGTSWQVWAPVYVSPGDTSPLAHDDPNVNASPTTAWTAGQYATFSDGPYRWNGAAWQAITLVAPGDTTTLAHTNLAAQPDPTTAWADTEYATFSDGTYQWTGTAWQAVATTARTNLCPDPRYYGPDTTGGGGAAGWAQEDLTTGGPDAGGWTRITATTNAGGFSYVGNDTDAQAAVTPGKTYTGSAHILPPGDGQIPWARVRLSWRRADGSGISATNGPQTPRPGPGWGRYAATGVAPADAAFVIVFADLGYVAGNPNNIVAGDTIGVACRMIEAGDTLAGYFDGDYPDTGTVDYSWTGTANDSPSVERALVVTVSPGTTVDTPHDSPGIVPDPDATWADDDYATFSDGSYRWDGTAWVAYAGWVTVATNLILNPSFELSNSGWGFSGVAVISRETTWAAQGDYALKVAPSGGSGGVYAFYRGLEAVEVGKTYTITATVHLDAPQPGTSTIARCIYASWSGGSATSEPAPNVAGDHVVSLTFTPTGAMSQIRLYTSTSSGPLLWDLVTLVEGDEPLQFDGDTPDTETVRYEWTGTPGNSTSIRQETTS